MFKFLEYYKKQRAQKNILGAIRLSCQSNLNIVTLHDELENSMLKPFEIVDDPIYLCEVLKYKDCIPTLIYLFKYGFNPNLLYQEGNLLHHVIENYNFDNIIDVLEVLIKYGCHVDFEHSDKGTPLRHACLTKNHNKFKIIELLIFNGADITKTTGKIPFHDLFKYLDTEFIFNNIDINSRNKYGYTLFHRALIYNAPLQDIKLLINESANIFLKGGYCHSPLIIATRYSQLDTIKFLLDNGAKVNEICNLYEGSDEKITALQVAVEKEKYDVVKLLINYGANYTICDNQNRDVLSYIQKRHILLDIFDTITDYEICKNNKKIGSDILVKDIPDHYKHFNTIINCVS